ncbi:hypothetical protein BGZ91_000108 [Linnemannia elongata]|nr:hypothetical protein BGZ91_000108 [Linnemannia elongata]
MNQEETPKLKKARSACEVTDWSVAGENELQDQDRQHQDDDEESVDEGSAEEGTRLRDRGGILETLTNPLANKRVDEQVVSGNSNKSLRKQKLTSEIGRVTSKPHHTRSAVFHLDVNGLTRTPYEVEGVDIGDGFYRLQRSGIALVNMKNLLATTNNFACLLSVNSIWDTSEDVPDIPAATIQHVKDHLTQEIVEFENDKLLMLCALEYELARGSVCHHQYSDQTDTLLCHIFQALRFELPPTYFAFELVGEDTFIHNVVHTLFVSVFEGYDIEWANIQSAGSKERRSERGLEGLRPDLTISKAGMTVLSLECKPPTYDRRSSVYLKDKWKLANLGKDEVDRQLKLNIDLSFHVVIQVFGLCMEVSTITLEHGVYHLHCHQKVYLPRARDDSGAVRNSIRALLSVKTWFDAFRFPPRYEEAGMRTPPAKAKQRKKTLISPTIRDLFSVPREP